MFPSPPPYSGSSFETIIERYYLHVNPYFTERHARALLKLPDEESRLMMLQRMVREEMNVKRTEEAIQETLEEMRRLSVQRAEQREKRYVRSSDFRLFTNTIKQSVEVIRRSGMDVLYTRQPSA